MRESPHVAALPNARTMGGRVDYCFEVHWLAIGARWEGMTCPGPNRVLRLTLSG